MDVFQFFLLTESTKDCVREEPYREDTYEGIFLSHSSCIKCSQKAMFPPQMSNEINTVFGENRTCAVITGDTECLFQHNFGSLIDSHDIVMRLNLHECYSPEHCGSRTTHALVNNQYCWLKRGRGEKIKTLDKNITVIYNHLCPTGTACMTNWLVMRVYSVRCKSQNTGNYSILWIQFLYKVPRVLSKG